MIESPPGAERWQDLDGQWHNPDDYPTFTPGRPISQRPAFWVLIIAVALAVALALHNFVFTKLDRLSKTPITIVYTVTGSSFFNVSYDTFTHGEQSTVQLPAVVGPWKQTVTGRRPFGTFTVNLSASNPTESSSTITCAITIGGKTLSRHTASGPDASVACAVLYF